MEVVVFHFTAAQYLRYAECRNIFQMLRLVLYMLMFPTFLEKIKRGSLYKEGKISRMLTTNVTTREYLRY